MSSEMKVLVLGMPRTGTQSLAEALIKLGISPVYHMREVGKNKHQELWIQALEAKFEKKGSPWTTKEDFDRILGDYQALSDYPASIFVEELIKAYPNALVILTVRPEEAWYKSTMATLWHGYSNGHKSRLSTTFHHHVWADDFPTTSLESYRTHNNLVREAAKNKPFLEYQFSQGWEPLCKFLKVPVPEEAFPRADDWAAYKAQHAEK